MTNTRIALIPAYQPTKALIPLAKELRAAGFALVIVDDGGGEAYWDIFEQAASYGTVISYTPNRGKGAALKAGLKAIRQSFAPPYLVVTLDADGQHLVRDVLRVAAEAEIHPSALTLGERGFDKGTPIRSRMGNSITRFVYRVSTGVQVFDTQTGLRAFNSGLLPFMLGIEGDRYEYEMNVLLACPKNRIPFHSVPIATVYEDNNSGSHFNTVKDSLRIYRNILKFTASSMIGFGVDYGLYSLLLSLLGSMGTAAVPVSNITARIVSSSLNFTINRELVFHSDDNITKSALQYFSLAAFILFGNTLMLDFLVDTAGINQYIAKLITELAFFSLSFAVQKFVIFKKKSGNRPAVRMGGNNI